MNLHLLMVRATIFVLFRFLETICLFHFVLLMVLPPPPYITGNACESRSSGQILEECIQYLYNPT